MNEQELKPRLQIQRELILEKIAAFVKRGSGWSIDKIMALYINVGEYRLKIGSSYIPLPADRLKIQKAIINVKIKTTSAQDDLKDQL